MGVHNQKEIDDFKEKFFKDKDYNRISSKILLLLERADDLVKIKWLARRLRCWIDKKVTTNDFLRISSIINAGILEDVEMIKVFNKRRRITSKNDLVASYVLDHLFSIGPLETLGIDGGDALGINSGTIYGLNKFGEIMNEYVL